MWTTKILVTLYLAVVAAGYSDGSNDGDAFCRIVTILLNPTLRDCQTLMKNNLDAFCHGNCSKKLAQALYDCGDSQYIDIIKTCVQDPRNSQFCGELLRNHSALVNLNYSCTGNDSCSEDCQRAVDSIGCCVGYAESGISLLQCDVQNCTKIVVNTSQGERLKCYYSHLKRSSSLNKCHENLIASTISQNSEVTTSFCAGNCPSQVVNLYSECRLFHFATVVKNGCAKDEQNRYCGNVVHPSINPEWEILVDKAIIDCKGRDCSNRVCKAAIDKIGCCLALDVQVNDTISTLLPISHCDIQHCQNSSMTLILRLPASVLFGTLIAAVFLGSPHQY